ncbi:MAG TPA: GWxTD domain-containing protein [Chryseolinea sp.]|nr:GWxTD domain-containing protein [Chryseolinea sp.]
MPTIQKFFLNFQPMMRYLKLFLLFISVSTQAQSLREINYSYRYNPAEPFSFAMKPQRSATGWNMHYRLQLRDTSILHTDEFVIRWDVRKDLSDKEGILIKPERIAKSMDNFTIEGNVGLDISADTQIVVVRVLNNVAKRAWLFWQLVDPNYPVDGIIINQYKSVLDNYIKTGTKSIIQSADSTKVISYYNDNFPAAAPGFSEGLARVSPLMNDDSTYSLPTNTEIDFTLKGLYLVQKDTSETHGFSFRVEEDYPRFEKVESLADPLIYVCTKQEYDRVKNAKGDKRAFDKVVLSITGDANRAKTFMRSYFKRVETANQLFTSYKEGWKTDRGMIYIIFGLPDQVFAFTDREVWTYNTQFDISFNFTKSSTIFDPDNYVLIRDKKYTETWYEVIDLWRNARF